MGVRVTCVIGMAPAGVRRTGRGPFRLSLPKHHSGRNPSIMTDQPSRVTPGEISALLNQARVLTRGSPLADQIAYHQRKASLLSRIAAHLDTAEAHQVAADAWHHVGVLASQRDTQEVRP
jgi:hypothetical protein